MSYPRPPEPRSFGKHEPHGQIDVFPSYRGGHTTTYNGYVYEYCPGHPLSNIWGYVAQHRLIGEDLIGRSLMKGEVVHHIDENRVNNDPSNLQVMNVREHRAIHAKITGERLKKVPSREVAKAALEKAGTIKGAARALGIHHASLRNHYPDLCLPYRRKSPVKIEDPYCLQEVLEAAPDPNIGIREISEKTGICGSSILNICKYHGVEWVKKKRQDSPRMTYKGKPTKYALSLLRENALEPARQLDPH